MRSQKDKELKNILVTSRQVSGKTIEYVAHELGVSKKTVYNWEYGLSEPSASQFLRWFPTIGLNPIPYIYNYYFPRYQHIKPSTDDKRIKEAFKEVSKLFTTRQMRIMMLVMKQKASDIEPLWELFLCYLQNGQFNRIINATGVVTAYELDGPYDPDAVQPNIQIVKKAIEKAKEAYAKGNKGYIVLEREKE